MHNGKRHYFPSIYNVAKILVKYLLNYTVYICLIQALKTFEGIIVHSISHLYYTPLFIFPIFNAIKYVHVCRKQ